DIVFVFRVFSHKIVCVSLYFLKMKRKSGFVDSEAQESKRRKRLEDAKKFIERSGATYQEAAHQFGVDRKSLSKFIKFGHQKLGRPSLLKVEEVSDLCTYLSALDTAHLQQSILSASQIIQQISGSERKPSAPTVRKYVRETGMNIRKVRSADQGRVRAIESIEDFIHYYDVIEEKLDQIAHDPHRIFNVDEVGIQFAEWSIHLITGHQYLNKNMVQTSIHVTFVLCTSPAQGGLILPPHFLFQQAESSEPRNLLCRTVNCTSDYNSTGYQDVNTWKCWMCIFIVWKNQWLHENGYGPNDSVLLLLDGHYSHLDHNVLFTAAMNHVEIVCMLAHATHLVQPNDKSINKRFKQNLDEDLAVMASNDAVIHNYDIAHLCEKALEHENMKKAIISSYQQVCFV